jgi:hypothetical protein
MAVALRLALFPHKWGLFASISLVKPLFFGTVVKSISNKSSLFDGKTGE